MKKIIIILFIIGLTKPIFAQTKYLPVYGFVFDGENQANELNNRKADIYLNDTILFASVTQNDTGMLIFKLPYDKIFKMIFKNKGYQPMSYLISTKNIPENAPKNLLFNAIIGLVSAKSDVDYSLLEIPVLKFKYDNKLKDFNGDDEYNKVMGAALRTLGKLEVKSKAESEQKVLLLKKEAESKLSEKELAKQKLVRNGAIAGVLFLLVFLFFIFRSLQKNIKQKKIISDKHTEIEAQKRIIEEKQKDIIDSITYARRIQRSLLPTEKYIDKSLTNLQDKKPSS